MTTTCETIFIWYLCNPIDE